jgi:hypothetical protein
MAVCSVAKMPCLIDIPASDLIPGGQTSGLSAF